MLILRICFHQIPMTCASAVPVFRFPRPRNSTLPWGKDLLRQVNFDLMKYGHDPTAAEFRIEYTHVPFMYLQVSNCNVSLYLKHLG